jgi:hypothetical protein
MSVLFNQTNVAPGTSFSGEGGGGGSNFPNGLTTGTAGYGGLVIGLSTTTATLNTNQNNYFWNPVYYSLNPASSSQGGRIALKLTYNPDDAGQTGVEIGADSNGAGYIGAVWDGYISMPLEVWGATINMYSDNETFMFMDGKAGAIGSISTGVELLSAQNTFSTITDPTKQYTADMTALLSTLKSIYPDCFTH